LGVHVFSHEVGNSRAKGKVEVSFKIIQEFEKVSLVKKWQSIEEANNALLDYLYYINNREHSVTREAPFERWNRITCSNLLNAPNEEIFRLLHLDEARRQIRKDMTISLNGVNWQLPFRKPFIDHMGQMVELFWYPGEQEKIYVVLNNKEYEVEYAAKKMRSIGRHDELPIPEALERRQAIEAEKDDPGLQLTGHYKDRHRRVYLPKEGQDFDDKRIVVDEDIKPLMRTKLWFISSLQKDFLINTPPTTKEREWIEEIFTGKQELPDSMLKKIKGKLTIGEIELKEKAVNS